MKNMLLTMGIAAFFFGCQEESAKKSVYTGTQSVYPLQAGSDYPVDGTVTFKEKIDGTADIRVELNGVEGEALYPVHLHMGDIKKDGASVAALLNPVSAKTVTSDTQLKILANETSISYKELVKLNACIKVHLSASGPNQDVVLAGGNIGLAATENISDGRVEVAVCLSK